MKREHTYLMLKDTASIYLRKIDGKITRAMLNIPISIVTDSAFPTDISGEVTVELQGNKLVITLKDED